jgi:hypothetical protein
MDIDQLEPFIRHIEVLLPILRDEENELYDINGGPGRQTLADTVAYGLKYLTVEELGEYLEHAKDRRMSLRRGLK